MDARDILDEEENVVVQLSLDDKRVQSLLNDIRKAWNSYFWEYHFCQKEIRFTKEEKSNHANDVFSYFEDILVLFSSVAMPGDYRAALPYTVSTLQFMFIQQDLIDELCRIFAIPQSSSEDKKLIRDIRNQLIGHPVSRDDNGLVSTVFIMQQSHSSRLVYDLYSRDKDFASNVQCYKWVDLFQKHENYLVENLNRILVKIETVLRSFKKTLGNILKNHANMPFPNLVTWVGQAYAPFQKDNYLFSPDNILYCNSMKNMHPRYLNAVSIFMVQLNDYLTETIKLIDEFLDRRKIKINETAEFEVGRPVLQYVSSGKVITNSNHDRYRHPLVKIHEYKNQHPLYTADYLLADLSDDPMLKSELEHIKYYSDNDAEFYCAFEYVELLMKERGLLRP